MKNPVLVQQGTLAEQRLITVAQINAMTDDQSVAGMDSELWDTERAAQRLLLNWKLLAIELEAAFADWRQQDDPDVVFESALRRQRTALKPSLH